MGFTVHGSLFRVHLSGLRVQGLVCRGQTSNLMLKDSGFRVEVLWFRIEVCGFGVMVKVEKVVRRLYGVR